MSTPLPATVSNERVRACADKFKKRIEIQMKTCTNMINKDSRSPSNNDVCMTILLKNFTSGNGWVAKDIECFVVLFASRCLQKRRVNHNIFSNHESIIIYPSRSPEKRVAGVKLCERSRVQWNRVVQGGQLNILKRSLE